MIFYTLEVILFFKLFSEIWVSSDAPAYLVLCRSLYPEIACVNRPKELVLSTTFRVESLCDFYQLLWMNMRYIICVKRFKNVIIERMFFCFIHFLN